jgi:hypothetical protein
MANILIYIHHGWNTLLLEYRTEGNGERLVLVSTVMKQPLITLWALKQGFIQS